MTPAAYVLDVETVPEGLEFGAPIELPECYRLTAESREEGLDHYLRRALHPRRCQVVAAAVAPLPGGTVEFKTGPEVEILEWLETIVAPGRGAPTLLAWNGPGFDYPVLRARALVHGLHRLAPVFAPQVWGGHGIRYPERLLDLMRFAPECLPGRRVSKAAACDAWRIDLETPPGSTVPALWSRGDLDTIEAHVVEDVVVERQLARLWRVAQILGVS